MTGRRDILPARRQSDTIDISFSGVAISMMIGRYVDGRIGEVFLTTRKAGSAVDIAARDAAVLMSLCLQHGCPATTMAGALTRDAYGRPEGMAGQVAEILAKTTGYIG